MMVWRTLIVCGIVVGLWVESLSAQVLKKSDNLTTAGLQKQIKLAQNNDELPVAIRDRIVVYLQDAVERLELAQEQIEKAEQFEQKLPQVADSLQATRERLAQVPTSFSPAIIAFDDIEELETEVDIRSKQLDDSENGLRKRIANFEADAEQFRTRPKELVTELADVDDRLQEIDAQIAELATSGESRDLMQAHRTFLQTRRQRAECERRSIKAEAAWFQSTAAANLLEAQRELASRELAVKVAELKLLEADLDKRRGDEADQRVRHAQLIVSRADSDLQPVATENLDLAKERRDLSQKLQELEHSHEATAATLAELEKEFDRTRKMDNEVGSTDSIGLLLRQQRARLSNPRGLRATLSHRNDLVRESRMRLFQLESDRAALVDLDAAAARRAKDLGLTGSRSSMEVSLKSLLDEQRQLLKGLEGDYSRKIQQVIENENVERRLLKLSTDYTAFIDERVLWIRTGSWFGGSQLSKLPDAIAWITASHSWQSAFEAMKQDAFKHPFLWILVLGAFSIWVCFRASFKGFAKRLGGVAAHENCRELAPTFHVVGLTFLIASGWLVLVGFVGYRLDHNASASPFVHAIGAGLMRIVTFVFPIEVLRVACMRGGLAEHHFGWSKPLIRQCRANISWYLPLGLVALGLIGMIEGTSDEHRLDSLGRLTYLVYAMLSAVFCYLVFREIHGLSDDSHDDFDADRRSILFWKIAPKLAVVASLGLLMLCCSGYFYTALQLTWRLQRTTWLLVGLLILRATIRRWIALERRRMAILQDEELQSIADKSLHPGNAGQNPFLFPRWSWPDFRLNLTQIVTQMRRLLDTGLIAIMIGGMWFVWSDVTPALNILEKVTIWQTMVEQTVVSVDAGKATAKTERVLKPVTAANLGLAVLIVAIAAIASRNIPGLVEVILLEHLSVDAGIRFATTYLVRYAIFVTGVCLAFGQIGIGWNNVQWLVAAASVGLGFGLQEIFSNFVSGVILLFERPMRVGDVITVGDTTGTVSRIRFRATTIVDGDRKELIVPNREFITGKLLNWTLSDRVNRVAVKVIVSGNHDPQQVRQLLLEIAARNPQLLKDPAPTANLEQMDESLTFVLRAFLPSLDGRSTVVNDLYTSIHHGLNAEGITLPHAA